MIKHLKDLDVKNKRVILRVDYNVPIENGQITNTKKIDATFETIDYLVQQEAKIIIMSHFGRVKFESDKEENSLKPVYDYLKSLNKYNILFCSINVGSMIENISKTLLNGQIVLVENTRFQDVKGNMESDCDIQLSMYWASLADVYINDAFATMHRNHASITGIPKYITSGIGFLVEKELKYLEPLIKNPTHPFVVIMGGAKLDDKIELIYSLAETADYILLGGGIANTFLKANGYDIGSSLVSDESLKNAKAIMQEFKDKIILPQDVITSPTYTEEVYELKKLDEIVIDDVIGDIGSKTLENYKHIIEESKTIFMNGTVGMYEQKPFSNGTQEILEYVSKTEAVKIVGGGDAGTAVKKYNYEDKMDFISTGGGATLSFIANRTLPGLEILRVADEENSN